MIERLGLVLIRLGEWLAGYRRVRKVIINIDTKETMLDYLCQEKLVRF